ncbi:putative B3 domain-containing protein REM15 [Raphanus sativus]|uniref:B3 domain-containing protein REM14 n=2 Tax=Raphanus sativus TaxID=3726 RepID=A0A6J0MTG6_RAPSA|nr:B3 domain-containing protein REM14 [Raphanus sativus]XP_056851409.1 B3 domain-containing protein REM14 [Raphanus sativus]XP_056851410.1 B3 domain-containing protein REM14 [Raphanus sativus]XP_056860863.1 B3 domain-containing protein REM14-like [Raphanus sativus]XP_056860864.1 B3 domain-containing protein REM14-like [Raphanus sativus]XP_056860865.1 B3 domain-containing protein REM14-like [Raphanus sativus]KAJ4876967.1 putative B3 domain-containing protein REM15 [Raphanus sativus]KAJ4907314
MAKKHFLQPLLPGFHTHLTIPVAFFSKHIQGRNDQKTTAKLRSDTSEKTWEVKKTEDEGRRLTDGWKEFALAHDLRVGDVLIFRLEKDMTFHVTLFGPSCCEIQYDSSCLADKNNIQRKINLKKKNPKREAECSSSDPSCFLGNVMPSTLRYDSLNLPMSFVRANGLETRCGEIVLMNEKGRSWTLTLKPRQCGRSRITGGWRGFCSANGLKAGDLFTFKLIKRGATLVLLLKSPSQQEDEGSEADEEIESLSTESDSHDEESNQDEKRRISIWKASSSPSLNRFVTLTLKPYNVTKCILFLPKPFTDLHGITVGTKMSLLDKQGVKWCTKLRSEGKRIRMAGGWKGFFKANCVKTGESIKLKLIWEDDTSCVLKFYSKVE